MPRCAARKPLRNGSWHRFLADENGVTAVEYGLITALIGLTIIGAVSSAGQAIKSTLYGQIVTALENMTK